MSTKSLPLRLTKIKNSMIEIGKNIRNIRDVRGISQQYLSEKIGISQKQLSRIENEKISPTLALLERICETLEVRLSDILHFNEHLVFNNYNQNHGGEFGVYNNTEVKQIEQLYKQLLQEKERIIAFLERSLSN